ncbi:hypothetical protein BN000_04295 [Mycobacterium europaeum]|uniref:Uncharacterized protein n=1 Tax=Mycobacterium europaeum TaxID=761804 RepID=A0A0U1DLE2_9MYCO|nr:hypothetical protein BN000_04295 [Mycobacterium europaeum]
MALSNSAVIFAVAMLVHACKKTAIVRERPADLLLVPSFIIGIGVTTLVPIGIAMSSTTSLLIINLCSAVSTILSIAYFWVRRGGSRGLVWATMPTVDQWDFRGLDSPPPHVRRARRSTLPAGDRGSSGIRTHSSGTLKPMVLARVQTRTSSKSTSSPTT